MLLVALAPVPTPALPDVSIELPSMYSTLFEFCFHESEFVFTVCYQISRQIPLSDKILLSTFLEVGDISETHCISSFLRAFSFVYFREQFAKHGETIGSDGATLCSSLLSNQTAV